MKKKTTFHLESKFKPEGDQPNAIRALIEGLERGYPHQTLLGVTGSGKTFTVANIIEKFGKPALVIAHNKTLAAQLAQEYRGFFPKHAVHYFVSYYDFYQPEAYIAHSDTYIEKDAQINDEIDRLRHAATQALLTRRDVVVVASVSAIYGLGSPEEYEKENLRITQKEPFPRSELMRKLIKLHFERTNADLVPGTFRAVGNALEIKGAGELTVYRLEYDGNSIEKILKVNPLTQNIEKESKDIFIFPAKHFITSDDMRERALGNIQKELKKRVKYFESRGELLAPDRIRRRTNFDIAMIREVGYCNGIENYSRHLSGRAAGERPET